MKTRKIYKIQVGSFDTSLLFRIQVLKRCSIMLDEDLQKDLLHSEEICSIFGRLFHLSKEVKAEQYILFPILEPIIADRSTSNGLSAQKLVVQ